MTEYSQYYEKLIKSAFIYKLGIYEDPASLCTVECFTEDNIDSIKCVTGYSIKILNNGIMANHNIPSEEVEKLESYIGRIISSKDLAEVGQVIEKYFIEEKQRYYSTLGNILVANKFK